ncbi:MAG: type II toxin-antitoxin system PemK/MazF family toxin [Pseudomonadota bacterium]|nr:type II toxin-antitoxin system PemK/MazF family toxin [Pseudomonadota bacterium]
MIACGHLSWINFDPQTGREAGRAAQRKNRPALVLTPRAFNALTGLLVACPMTRTERPWQTRVRLTGGGTSGFVMVEQVRSFDWRKRGAGLIENVPASVLEDVRLRLAAMLDFA